MCKLILSFKYFSLPEKFPIAHQALLVHDDPLHLEGHEDDAGQVQDQEHQDRLE